MRCKDRVHVVDDEIITFSEQITTDIIQTTVCCDTGYNFIIRGKIEEDCNLNFDFIKIIFERSVKFHISLI